MAAYSSILAWKIPGTKEQATVHEVAESDRTEPLTYTTRKAE